MMMRIAGPRRADASGTSAVTLVGNAFRPAMYAGVAVVPGAARPARGDRAEIAHVPLRDRDVGDVRTRRLAAPASERGGRHESGQNAVVTYQSHGAETPGRSLRQRSRSKRPKTAWSSHAVVPVTPCAIPRPGISDRLPDRDRRLRGHRMVARRLVFRPHSAEIRRSPAELIDPHPIGAVGAADVGVTHLAGDFAHRDPGAEAEIGEGVPHAVGRARLELGQFERGVPDVPPPRVPVEPPSAVMPDDGRRDRAGRLLIRRDAARGEMDDATGAVGLLAREVDAVAVHVAMLE